LADKEPPEWENRLTVIGLKAVVHSSKFGKWNIYGGMLFNYNIIRIRILRGDIDFMQDHQGFRNRSSNVSFSGFVGSRYEISPKANLFGELGFGASLLNVGMGYQLKNKI